MTANVTMAQLLKTQAEKHASDLHISAGSPPQIRIDGELYPIKVPPLGAQESANLCLSILSDRQKKQFEVENEIDVSFSVRGLARFRGNIFLQRGSVSGVFRLIPFSIRSFESLNLPPVVQTLCDKHYGLVLVTGATGSGKSTTLAAMIDRINERKALHILTIEDPIEFGHNHKRSIVTQREVGMDTKNFATALRSALRQDPDVVLIGEMRDLETVSAAMTMAETGHLVFGTLHTNSAVSTINRIIDVFPAHQQNQIRSQLAATLQGVVCQELLPAQDGGGRVMAAEILIPNAAVRSQIREDKLHLIQQTMQVASDKAGMVTRNQSLLRLVSRRQISARTAIEASYDPDEIKAALGRVSGRSA